VDGACTAEMGSDVKQAYVGHDTAEVEGAPPDRLVVETRKDQRHPPPDSAGEGWVLRVIRKIS